MDAGPARLTGTAAMHSPNHLHCLVRVYIATGLDRHNVRMFVEHLARDGAGVLAVCGGDRRSSDQS